MTKVNIVNLQNGTGQWNNVKSGAFQRGFSGNNWALRFTLDRSIITIRF